MNSQPRHRQLDVASTATIVVTLVLFVASILYKGLTHDVLLEIGVFLVSVKLILASHKNELLDRENKAALARIEAHVASLNNGEVEPAPHDVEHVHRGAESGAHPHRATS